jgi:hypothetical protein
MVPATLNTVGSIDQPGFVIRGEILRIMLSSS